MTGVHCEGPGPMAPNSRGADMFAVGRVPFGRSSFKPTWLDLLKMHSKLVAVAYIAHKMFLRYFAV